MIYRGQNISALAIKPEDLSLIPGTHMVEVEKQLLRAVTLM